MRTRPAKPKDPEEAARRVRAAADRGSARGHHRQPAPGGGGPGRPAHHAAREDEAAGPARAAREAAPGDVRLGLGRLRHRPACSPARPARFVEAPAPLQQEAVEALRRRRPPAGRRARTGSVPLSQPRNSNTASSPRAAPHSAPTISPFAEAHGRPSRGRPAPPARRVSRERWHTCRTPGAPITSSSPCMPVPGAARAQVGVALHQAAGCAPAARGSSVSLDRKSSAPSRSPW